MKKICEKCKTEFSCGSNNSTNEPCWCFSLPPVKLPENNFTDCLCQNCLLEFQKKQNELPESKKQAEALVEKEDYYFENGLMVLTEAYLKKRGFCCKNGCRHCPY